MADMADKLSEQKGATQEAKSSELELLQQMIQEKEKLVQQNWDQLLRVRAELENYRRRAEKEKTEAVLWGQAGVIKLLIPILDELEHAMRQLNSDDVLAPELKEGFSLVLKNFQKVFEQEGVVKVKAEIGKPYDPHCHEVVRAEESEDSDGLITEVIQDGFVLRERLLRPSKVVVSKKKV